MRVIEIRILLCYNSGTMTNLFLSELNIYPVKSLAGISIASSILERRGLKHDRRWMLIDPEHNFITQRQIPKMGLIKVKALNKGLEFFHKSMGSLFVPFNIKEYMDTELLALEVSVWGDKCQALSVGNYADGWFSEFLGIKCQLAYMPDNSIRKPDIQRSDNDLVSFADGFPVLLTTEGSLDKLNSKLEKPVPMNRFRPNIVIKGAEAYEEDKWKKIKIGEIIFDLVKPCTRCVIINTDQETAEVFQEPLKTLAREHKINNKVIFGQNLIPQQEGFLHLGDRVEILEYID